MQTILTLKDELMIPDEILQSFPLYISVSHQLRDNKLFSSMHNIFATKLIVQNHKPDMLFKIQVAYAVGVIFKMLLDQDTKFLDQLLQQAMQTKNEKLIWAFQFIQYTIYQLYKSDTSLYLGIILNNKQFEKYPLNEELVPLTTSSIYSLVLMTEMHVFFEKIQLTQTLPFQCINDSKFDPNVEITLFQVSQAYPPIVLIKYNEMQLEQHIWNNHVAFLKDTLLQLIIDATSPQQSTLVNKLKIQPYVVNTYEEFCDLLLVQDQDKVQQILSNEHLKKYFNKYLKSQDQTDSIENIMEKLKKNLIDTEQQHNQQQLQENLTKQQQEILGAFQTLVTNDKSKNGIATVRFITNAR